MTPANIFGAALERLNPSNLFSELPKPQIQRFGAKTEQRELANDDEPRYIRTPELDHRISRGDMCDANAWHCTASGQSRFFCVDYSPNERRWVRIDRRDLARACDQRQMGREVTR